MRLFAALDPPPDVLDTLRGAVDRGRRHEPGLRWSRPRDWHLTLVFLGEVGEDRLPALTDALGDEARAHQPLSLSVRGWGTFPPGGGRSSVLWAGLGGDTEALGALADGLRAAAAGAGLPVEHRPYVPHVTVARSRPARDLADIVRALGPLRSRGWRAHEVHLVESRVGKEDRYRTVRTWALGWEADPAPSPERSTS
ncbi:MULTISPECIES: RNA 2',3'-cyclic phosphodiesterase [Nocardiopsis]|uniref:RNA 2',3'-cyclic phosphodiesterase n=1 Tax=Nocardiopsis sinuspersici TaxID=501010 RepID=A0A1V3C4M8_9ACTN|nr:MULTISPECIES: RNA 2',3'-cyclic phosphodiesterase [Nocardiopsis]OOC55685.1 2'-5' RNA ligase [Nocardiopsis sinuspersici]